MRRFRLLVFTVLLAPLSRAQEPVKLTLADVFARVEAGNPSVLLGREAYAQAEAVARQQRVGLLPNVGASAQQRRTEAVSITNGAAVNGTPSTVNRFDGKLAGSLPLLNLQQRSAYAAARTGVSVAEADLGATLQSALATVARNVFAQLRNEARRLVLDANYRRAEELLKLARNQLAAGVATQIDVTRAEALLAQADLARLQQETILRQSALQLQITLDLDTALEIAVAPITLRPQTMTKTFSTQSTEQLFARRSDWVRLQRAVAQAKQDERTARYQRAPALGLTGEYGGASANYDSGHKATAWFAGATVTVPVFDGLKSNADRRLALSRQRVQEIRLRALENQIKAEIYLAEQDAASRAQQVGVAQTSLRLAEEELRLAQQRYQQGVADNREVIEAQNRLAIASDNAVEAIFQSNLSRVELARARGEVRDILAERTP